jgi:flagellin-like protein
MNKKAISPLISTVLLVAFAVAIAAVVMDWNSSYIRDTSNTARTESETQITCNLNLGMGIEDIRGEQQIC